MQNFCNICWNFATVLQNFWITFAKFLLNFCQTFAEFLTKFSWILQNFWQNLAELLQNFWRSFVELLKHLQIFFRTFETFAELLQLLQNFWIFRNFENFGKFRNLRNLSKINYGNQQISVLGNYVKIMLIGQNLGKVTRKKKDIKSFRIRELKTEFICFLISHLFFMAKSISNLFEHNDFHAKA